MRRTVSNTRSRLVKFEGQTGWCALWEVDGREGEGLPRFARNDGGFCVNQLSHVIARCAAPRRSLTLPDLPPHSTKRWRTLWAAWLLSCSLVAVAQHEKSPWPAKQALPALQGVDQYGKAWDWKALNGKVVVLNFWATWCAPCKEELPSLQTLADLQEGTVQVLTVNVKEPAQRAWRYAQTTGLQVPVIPDPQGKLTQAFGVNVFPTTVLINTQGRPIARVIGAVDWTDRTNEAWLQSLHPN